jgi:hypothetical protein
MLSGMITHTSSSVDMLEVEAVVKKWKTDPKMLTKVKLKNLYLSSVKQNDLPNHITVSQQIFPVLVARRRSDLINIVSFKLVGSYGLTARLSASHIIPSFRLTCRQSRGYSGERLGLSISILSLGNR